MNESSVATAVDVSPSVFARTSSSTRRRVPVPSSLRPGRQEHQQGIIIGKSCSLGAMATD